MSPGLALGSPWAHTEILGLTMQKQKFWAISEIADEASTDSKEKGMTQRGPDVHSKVYICLHRLKYSLYNILTLSKVFNNPGCNH